VPGARSRRGPRASREHLPHRSPDVPAHGRLIDSEVLGGRVLIASHLVVRNNRLRVSSPRPGDDSILLRRVGGVLGGRTQEEVVWPDARRVVTAVADEEVSWIAEVDLVGETVGFDVTLATATALDASVALLVA
jgi:hypothetical protein